MAQTHQSPRFSGGFTITEMMATIGIITILVGITMPAIRTFRMEGFNVVCQSNLRQLGTIVQSYLNQNHGLLPMVEFVPAVTQHGPQGGLPWACRGYIDKDHDCWLCPADHDDYGSLATGTSYTYLPGLIRYSPTVQIPVQQALIPSYLDPTVTEAEIERLRLGMEARMVTSFYQHDAARMPVLSDSVDRHPGTRIQRNALFFDGSVGISIDMEDLLDDPVLPGTDDDDGDGGDTP